MEVQGISLRSIEALYSRAMIVRQEASLCASGASSRPDLAQKDLSIIPTRAKDGLGRMEANLVHGARVPGQLVPEMREVIRGP
jgi:hypothetical protein